MSNYTTAVFTFTSCVSSGDMMPYQTVTQVSSNLTNCNVHELGAGGSPVQVPIGASMEIDLVGEVPVHILSTSIVPLSKGPQTALEA